MSNWSGSHVINSGTTGTLTSADSTHATNTGALWPTSAPTLVNYTIRILSGTGAGQERVISANTLTQVTVPAWTIIPDATSTYEILLILKDQDHIVGTFGISSNVISEIQDNATIYVDGNYAVTIVNSSVIRWNKSESTICTFEANNRTVQGLTSFWPSIAITTAKTTHASQISYIRIFDTNNGLVLNPSAIMGDGTTLHHIWTEDCGTSAGYASGGSLPTDLILTNYFNRYSHSANLQFSTTASANTQIFDTCWCEGSGIGGGKWGAANALDWMRNCVFKYATDSQNVSLTASRKERASNNYILSRDGNIIMGSTSSASNGYYEAFHNITSNTRTYYGAASVSTATFTLNSNDNFMLNKSVSNYSAIDFGNSTAYILSTSDYDYIAGHQGAAKENVDTTASTSSTASPAQYRNLTTARTNPRSVPNFPLTLDNVVVGTLTQTTADLTFDCANGALAGQCTNVNSDSNLGQPILNVLSSNPFMVGMVIEIGYGTARSESGRISAIGVGTITLETNLIYTHTTAQADSVNPQLRQSALPFISYGVTSGIYAMSSVLPHPDDWGLFWTGLKTTYNGVSYSWKKVGHSLTLVNLQSGTTYYAKAYAVNPFGQLMESAEFSFATIGRSGTVASIILA